LTDFKSLKSGIGLKNLPKSPERRAQKGKSMNCSLSSAPHFGGLAIYTPSRICKHKTVSLDGDTKLGEVRLNNEPVAIDESTAQALGDLETSLRNLRDNAKMPQNKPESTGLVDKMQERIQDYFFEIPSALLEKGIIPLLEKLSLPENAKQSALGTVKKPETSYLQMSEEVNASPPKSSVVAKFFG
jgi:hypothetical protein